MTVPERILARGIDRSDAMEFNRYANALMAGAARTLEQHASEEDPLFKQDLQYLYLDLQRIIFAYKSTAGRLKNRNQFDDANQIALDQLKQFVRNFKGSHVSNLKMRIPRYRNAANFVFVHPFFQDVSHLPLEVAIDLLIESLQAAVNDAPFTTKDFSPEVLQDIDAVKKVIPEQKVAPAHFDIVNGKLTVVDQQSTEKPDSISAIEASFDALVDSKNEILSDLDSSNCDKRLFDQINKLGELLESKKNIVRLALENINTRLISASYSDELSNSLVAKLEGFSSGVAMYVAQFSDWQTFVQNAAEAAIEDADTLSLPSAASDILKEIEGKSAVVDESVPRTLKFLQAMVADPKTNSRKVTFALIRTIENLVIKAFGYVLDVFRKTADKASDKVSDSVSSLLARAVTSIGIAGAITLLPIALRVRGLEWVQSSYVFIRDNIAPMANIF